MQFCKSAEKQNWSITSAVDLLYRSYSFSVFLARPHSFTNTTSVGPSVTCWYCVKTAKRIVEILLPLDSFQPIMNYSLTKLGRGHT